MTDRNISRLMCDVLLYANENWFWKNKLLRNFWLFGLQSVYGMRINAFQREIKYYGICVAYITVCSNDKT